MADESKKKAYYDSLVRAGVVQPETSFEAFNLKIRDDNYAKIVYSGLKTAAELNIVKGVPNENEFNSVLQVGQFPTQPEIAEDIPEVAEIKKMGTPVSGQPVLPPVSNVPTNQPKATSAETQIAPIEQQAGQVQGGMPQGQGLGAGQFQITDTRGAEAKPPVASEKPQMAGVQPQVTGVSGESVIPVSAPQSSEVNPYQFGVTKLGEFEAGLIGGIGSELRGISELGYSLDNKIVNALKGTPLEGSYSMLSKPEDSWIYQAGKGLENFAEKDIYRNPEYAGGLTGTVATALGQVGSIMVQGGLNPAGGIMKLGRGALTNRQLIANGAKQLFSRPSVAGAFQMVGAETQAARQLHKMANSMDKDAYVLERVTAGENAKDAGNSWESLRNTTEDEVASSIIPTALFAGSLEAIPLERLMARLGKPVTNVVIDAFKQGGVQGAEEAIQETLQQLVLNAGIGQTYNEAQRLTSGLYESAEGGGATGFVLGSVLTALTGKRAKIRQQVQNGEITQQEAIAELEDINKAETLVQDKLQALDNQLLLTEGGSKVAGLLPERTQTAKDKKAIPMGGGGTPSSGQTIVTPSPYEVANLPEAQTYFNDNKPSETNPLNEMTSELESIFDKIADGVMVSPDALHGAYQWANGLFPKVIRNNALSDAEKGATLNILSGMLADIDKANTEGQKFIQEVEAGSVQDRVPAVREGVKTLPAGQEPKGQATITPKGQGESIRQARRVRGGVNVLPSSGEVIVTPQSAQQQLTIQENETGKQEVPMLEGVRDGGNQGQVGQESTQLRPQETGQAQANAEGEVVAEDIKNEPVVKLTHYSREGLTDIDNPISFFDENIVSEEEGGNYTETPDVFSKDAKEVVEIEVPQSKIYIGGDTEIDALISKSPDFVFDTRKSKDKWTNIDKKIFDLLKAKGFDAFKYPKGSRFANEVVLLSSSDIKKYSKPSSQPQQVQGQPKALADVEEDVAKNIETAKADGGFKPSTYNAVDVRTPTETSKLFDNGVVVYRKKDSKNNTWVVAIVGYEQFGGRTGYTMAMIKDNGNLPDNIEDTLTLKAAEDWFNSPRFMEDNKATQASKDNADRVRPMIEAKVKEIKERQKTQGGQNAVQIESTAKVPVQPKAGVSPEVAEGKPQAKPESPTQQGKGEATATEAKGEVVEDLSNIEELTKGVDFDKLVSDAKNAEPLPIDEERELRYQESSFDKKWARTYQEAKKKLVEQYNNAKKVKEDWESRVYKSAGNLNVSVGGELEGRDVSVNSVNERRRKNQIKNAELEMESAKKDLKSLGLSDAEITELISPTTPQPTITPINATDVAQVEKIEKAPEKGRELALAKPTNKELKRAFDNSQDLSDRARKAGIYDGKTLKIGGQEITLDTPAKFKAFLLNDGNYKALTEALDKSDIDTLKSERDSLIQQFKKEMGKATMNLNPQQVSLLAQIAWKNLQILLKQTKLSSAGVASQIKKVVDNAILEVNQMLAQSGQTSLNPDKDDIVNIINSVRKLAEGVVSPSGNNKGQIGTAGQPNKTQAPIYTKEQEELARQMEKKMDEGKPFISRSEPFWTAVKRKTAELRQKLDSPKELLNFVEKMIGTTPGSSYNRTRELPLGRAMEQLRGKARSLALPYMERISEILKPIESNLPDFEKYLIYRRIIDRAIQDKANQEAYNQGLLKKRPVRRTTGGITETNADILLNDLRNKIGADMFDKFTQAGDDLQQVFDDNLKDLVDAGVLTQDRYDAIKAQNEFYIPFDVVQRDFRGNVITGTEYDRTNAQGQSVIKKITGVDTPKNAADADKTVEIFYKMMQNGDIDVDSYYYLATEKITDARNQGNITQQEYEELMDSLSEPGLELHSPLNKTLNIINASQYQVARQGYMEDVDRLIDADTNNDYFKRLEDGEKLPSGMAIITYYKDGVQQRVAVDEKLKQAIDGMTKPELSAFEQVLKFGSFWFKIAATSASVTFLPTNFVIDTVRTLTSKAGLGSGANITERVASVVQVPVLYSEALVESIIGNLLNTKLGNALGLKSITPDFMFKEYEAWRKSPSYSEGTYMNYFTDKLKSGRTQNEIEDAKFLETVQRRTQTILGNPKTAKAISEAMLGARQKTRLTVDGLIDIINTISKILENSHKIYGNIKLSGTEAGVRRGLDTYIGGYIDKLHSKKRLTQAELENAIEEINDEILNNIGSPNFEQIPPNMRAASVMIPFLGAAVKGNMTDISRMMNAVNAGASAKERKDALIFSARNAAVFTIPAFMTGLAMALKSDDDEEKKMYDDMDENSKWKNMIIPIEREIEGEGVQADFVTIPIRGLPVIFNSIGRASGQAFGEAIKDKLSDEEIKRIVKDLLTSSGSEMMTFNLADKTYLSDIDPETGERKTKRKEEEWINRGMSAISGLNPLIKYPLERIANKNFFGKYPLLPENIRGKMLRNAIMNEVVDPKTGKPYSPSLLKNKFTPEYSVNLSKKLERNGVRISPIAIDHFFDTFLAGAPEKFDVGASELMNRRFLWKERKLAYGQKPKTN